MESAAEGYHGLTSVLKGSSWLQFFKQTIEEQVWKDSTQVSPIEFPAKRKQFNPVILHLLLYIFEFY